MLYKSLFLFFLLAISPFSYSQTLFSPAQLVADIDSMNRKILEIHPNPFTVIDSVGYFREIEEIKKSINRPLTADEFYRLVAPVTIRIGDGHTGLTPDQSRMNVTRLRFPFDVYINDNRLFVVKNHSLEKGIPPGSEILKINGIPTEEVLAELLKYSPGESDGYKMAVIEGLFPMVYRFTYGECDEFTVEIQEVDHVATYHIDTIESSQLDLPEFMKPSGLYFRDGAAVLDLRNFQSPDFTSFIESAFDRISAEKCESVIVDLRYNTGGQANLADSLISYLTDKEYRSMVSDSIKISFSTAYYIKQLESMNLGEKAGDIYVWNGMPVQPVERKNRFDGSLYVLTGPMTYSTAAFFANVVQCYGLGTVIGAETGQPMIAYGDTFTYLLPNTQLPCGIARQKFVFCCAENEGEGVLPDYTVERNLNDVLAGKDTVLEFTLELAKNRK